MKILLTGASSFTGFWIAKVLSENGHQIIATLQKSSIDEYDGIRKERLNRLKNLVQFIPSTSIGSHSFIKSISNFSPDLLALHGHDNTNYRSPHYDKELAVQSALHQMDKILVTLMESNSGAKVLQTGTYFEQGEGQGDLEESAINPYAASKAAVYKKLEKLCEEYKTPLSKFIISNPFGPFEEGRFTTHLINCWKRDEVAVVKTPSYLRDNIHASALALSYNHLISKIIDSNQLGLRLAPSQYRESQKNFALRFAREISKRSNLSCRLEFMDQKEFPEPKIRFNSDLLQYEKLGWSEDQAWDEIALFYQLA